MVVARPMDFNPPQLCSALLISNTFQRSALVIWELLFLNQALLLDRWGESAHSRATNIAKRSQFFCQEFVVKAARQIGYAKLPIFSHATDRDTFDQFFAVLEARWSGGRCHFPADSGIL